MELKPEVKLNKVSNLASAPPPGRADMKVRREVQVSYKGLYDSVINRLYPTYKGWPMKIFKEKAH